MRTRHTLIFILIAIVLGLTACDNYLNIVPKGKKIPNTLGDFEALLRDEYTIGESPILNALYLMNDRQLNKSSLNALTLSSCNYLWNEEANRIDLNIADESTYYSLYAAISSCNLIIDNVPTTSDATEAQKNEVIAYAKVIRALTYYTLTNYYADAYSAQTAAQKRSVPYITNAEINAPFIQPTIEQLYESMITDVEDAIKLGIPSEAMTIIHPNKGAAYGMLARLYLQKSGFQKALEYANLALKENNHLYDWRAYYAENKEAIESPDNYSTLPTPLDYSYIENYYFRHGDNSPNRTTTEPNLPVERASRFEKADAKFLSQWKLRTQNTDTFYQGLGKGYFNWGGITTVEMYCIKAECLIRMASGNDLSQAMSVINQVRRTRILSEYYTDLEAHSVEEAMRILQRLKMNELIFSIIPMADAKRWNAEGKYPITLSKTYNGKTLSLKPDSHLWTIPFPNGATNNPGNGTIIQNVNK